VKRDHLVLYMAVFGFLMAVALLLMAVGLLADALGLVTGGVVLFVLVLWLPLAWFTANVARRLDVLAETGNDLELFKENGRRAEKETERA
jgi:hypothetical protein